MNNLKVFIDNSHSGNKNHPEAIHRWSWLYAHGKFERDFNFDIVLCNQELPEISGTYLGIAENGKEVIIKMVLKRVLEGRCCYLDDSRALKYVLTPDRW